MGRGPVFSLDLHQGEVNFLMAIWICRVAGSAGGNRRLAAERGVGTMNERDLEAAVLRALEHASGEVGDRPIDPERPLAAQFALDEERFVQALARETGLDIPVEDRAELSTLSGCLEYLGGGLSE
jgi:hypothetical protein